MNETLGWCRVMGGLLGGVLLRLRFHEEMWLGGYASFPRRMLRLGHVALVALGLLNVVASRSLAEGALSDGGRIAAGLALGAGALLMPATCAVVAVRPRLRPAFALPIAALLIGVGLLIRGSLS